MIYKTTELTITLHPNTIVEVKAREDLEGIFTMEGAKENRALLEKIIDNKPRCILLWIPKFYISKDIIKYNNEFEQDFITTAFITSSFSSKILGNLVLTLRSRFLSSDKIKNNPIKLFTDREEALSWLLEIQNSQQ